MRVYDAKVNHMTNPMGFFMDGVSFSWKVDEARGKAQKAARVRVAADEKMQEILFDSGMDEQADSLAYPVELALERISHFENRLHKVYATLTDGSVIPLSQKLSAILESVTEQEIFLRCHQSYIVNLAHVRTLEDTFFQMEDGTSIPISRAFYKEAKNAYYHYRLR